QLVMYPAMEPFDQGMLDVGDGNRIYWEVCGNPQGKPAVVLHGGPGSGCTPGMRRFFDPAVYRIVLFDQRGCGRSIPHASDYAVDLASNATHHLIRDIERLREHLTIDRWLVFGGSWGSTLALAYGERFPERVSEMVVVSVVTTTYREVHWVTRDVGHLAGIPAVLIHGRIDLSSPIDIPWQLGQGWPGSQLVIVDNAGHGTGEPGVAAAVVSATDRFALRERANT